MQHFRQLLAHRFSQVVWAILVGLGVFVGLVAWAVASPSGSSLDEDFHLASIWCPNPGSEACPFIEPAANGSKQIMVPADIADRFCYFTKLDQSAQCVSTDVGDTVTSTRFNDGVYPGAYYTIMHLFASDDVNSMALAVRLANAALASILLTMLLLLLGTTGKAVYVWMIAATAAPMVAYHAASVAPDSWSFIGVTTTCAATMGALLAQRRWRQWSLSTMSVVGVVVAAAARSDSAAFCVVVALAALIVYWRRLRSHWPALAGFCVTTVIGVIGFLSGSQATALSGGIAGYHGDGSLTGLKLAFHNILFFPEWISNILSRGLFDMGTYQIVAHTLTICLAVTVWVGVFRGGMTLAKGAGLVLVGGCLVGAPVMMAQMEQLGLWQDTGIQPRYVMPLLTAFVAITLAPVRSRPTRYFSLPATIALAVMALVMQAATLHIWIRRWVTGTDVFDFNLDVKVEWWRAIPLSPMGTWVVGTLGFALAACAIITVRYLPEVAAVTHKPSHSGSPASTARRSLSVEPETDATQPSAALTVATHQ
ncbi:MAG: DUF2142 domain-containing protein [Propionibacteriaceae bacterium]|jgi:hypothetical protein|nr:DUF2142 domain-containing protein [Propionibacteriaceae bacterium]